MGHTPIRLIASGFVCWVCLLSLSLLELINHLVKIRIASAKAPGEPVSATFGDSLSVGQHLKLTSLSGRNHGFSAKPLFYHGHETRDLGFIVLSCRAGTYLNFHVTSNGHQWLFYPGIWWWIENARKTTR